MTTIKEALQKGSALLSCIPDPYLEARVLMSHILDMAHAELIVNADKTLSKAERTKYFKAIHRRAKREPSAYITQTKEFFGRSFLVNKNVLIPRPDTETLVTAITEDFESSSNCNILELGVGSGCIAVNLLKILPNIKITASEISKEAIEVARRNAKLHGVTKSLCLIKSNWYENVKGRFAIIYSNPPYISQLTKLKPELCYEPQIALFAEKKGLKSYQHIAEKARDFLTDKGCLYVEIPKGKENVISKIFAHNKMLLSKSYLDLSGTIRCLRFEVSKML